MRTRLTADFVLGFDGRGHVLFRNGEVVIEGTRIVHAGGAFAGEADRTFSFGRALIGPGFIDLDALGDIDSTVLTFEAGDERAQGRVWTEAYLRAGPTDAFTRAENIGKFRHAFAGLIRNGITTAMPITSMTYRAWAESPDEMAGVAAIAAELGLRCYLGPCVMSGLTYQQADGSLARHTDPERAARGLAGARRFIADHDGAAGGLVRGALLPDRIETCTDDLLDGLAAIQRETGVPLRIHCCQSVYEVETVLAERGVTSLGLLERHGLLGPKAVLPHGIYLSGHPLVSRQGDEDIARLAASGATVVHCPVVFARDGEALVSFGRYQMLGINLALGTDTHPPDLVDTMRQGVSIARIVEGRRDAARAAEFYNAATLGGARALGRDDLGRLSPGAQADLTVFDLSAFHLGPIVDPVKTMLLAGTGRDFVASFIAGRMVMAEGKVLGVDERALGEEADRLMAKLMAHHVARAPGSPTLPELFPPVLPVAG
ncbi:MAG: chlorohydrolase family protein [Hyphomicrobiaceae bacterium]